MALLLILTAVTAWYTNREGPADLPERGQAVSTKMDDTGSDEPVTRDGTLLDSSDKDQTDTEPSSVHLTITTTPSNSTIKIGEDEFDQVQGHVLSTGEYLLTVSAEGYDTYSETIQLEATDDTTLSVVLPPQGQLLVNSNIPGALVFINGENRGQVPFDEALPRGSYTVSVTAEGYAPYQRQVRVQSDNNVRISATFQAQRLIRIQVVPDGDIFINGSRLSVSGESDWFETSLPRVLIQSVLSIPSMASGKKIFS